ncbi:Mss4-like protein [Exophiala viscosa]|uniref:Mss4-like protein n=1 Tax=Exophiala viscosa TaxID=2486360 RepID=A0AAN6E771_9EURO|nr:Mss4-like protein [Exophiala viscosa]
MATTNHLTCLCGAVTEPATLLSSDELPLECVMCHCNTCRQQTGALAVSYLKLRAPPSEKSLDNVTAYETSRYERYFCKVCGCNVFGHDKTTGGWSACSGTLEAETKPAKGKNVSNIKSHIYVGDPFEGGIAPYLTRIADVEVPCWQTEPGEDQGPIKQEKLLGLREKASKASSTARDEMMQVACHCGDVSLRITPPPYDEHSEDWYIGSDHSRYYARLCCCRSCRLTLGLTMQPWTYVPPAQIYTDDMQPVMFGPEAQEVVQIKALKHYQSSDSVLRSFCSTCGATIFYQSFERPYVIDVSVGVIRSTFGNALVGEWLEWDRKMVSKRDEAVDEELIQAWLQA